MSSCPGPLLDEALKRRRISLSVPVCPPAGFGPPDSNGLRKCLTCCGRGGIRPGNRTCTACAGQGYVRR